MDDHDSKIGSERWCPGHPTPMQHPTTPMSADTVSLEDIRERVVEVGETIAEKGRCSDGQAKALENWKRGVSGWVH